MLKSEGQNLFLHNFDKLGPKNTFFFIFLKILSLDFAKQNP